jgi:hypothetical protein
MVCFCADFIEKTKNITFDATSRFFSEKAGIPT